MASRYCGKNMSNRRGVNLGGWLIPEQWLTPKVFASSGASDLAGLLATKKGRAAYRHHVKTFITEDDFVWLAAQGVTLLRLPVGYWDFETSSGITRDTVDWVLVMAEKYHLSVLIDLHAAKGSQNGYEHSGKVGEVGWWAHQEATLQTLERIARRYRDAPALWGIELLNEPRITPRRLFTLLRFYRKAYRRLRTIIKPGTWIVFHDAFHPLLLSGALWRGKRGHPVAMDIHWYGIPTKYVKRWKLATYLRAQRYITGILLRIVRLWQPVIVGEWSAVAPQDYMERASATEYPAIWRANGVSQQQLYARLCVGVIYWTYKGEGRGVWHFRSMVEDGVLE